MLKTILFCLGMAVSMVSYAQHLNALDLVDLLSINYFKAVEVVNKKGFFSKKEREYIYVYRDSEISEEVFFDLNSVLKVTDVFYTTYNRRYFEAIRDPLDFSLDKALVKVDEKGNVIQEVYVYKNFRVTLFYGHIYLVHFEIR